MNIKTHIFREYDIRGIVEKDLTGNIPELIGRAFGSEVKKRLGGTPTIAVGHDNRPTSPKLADGIIKGIRTQGVTVVMVEQNAFAALELSDRAYVLDQGHVTMSGAGAALLNDPHVKAAYLGG